jgi:hypothetical protein
MEKTKTVPNVINLFTATIYECVLKARVFVLAIVSHLIHAIIYVILQQITGLADSCHREKQHFQAAVIQRSSHLGQLSYGEAAS